MIGYGDLTFEQALTDARFSHISTREWCGFTIAHVYFNEPTSPSGVLLAASAKIDVARPLIEKHGKHAYAGPTRGDIAASQWGIGGVRVP